MELKEIAEALCAHCRSGTESEGLKTLYAEDAVSVEAFPNPQTGTAETRGVEGIHGKHEWWASNFEVHSANVQGPFLHGTDRFGVIFEMDATDNNTKQRFEMKEIAVYTVLDGKIVREEFFYNM